MISNLGRIPNEDMDSGTASWQNLKPGLSTFRTELYSPQDCFPSRAGLAVIPSPFPSLEAKKGIGGGAA